MSQAAAAQTDLAAGEVRARLILGDGTAVFRVSSRDRALPLGDVMPVLQALGMSVLEQRAVGPFAAGSVSTEGGVRRDDFLVEFPGRAGESVAGDLVADAFEAALAGDVESDALSALAVDGIPWQDSAVLRAYALYLGQLGFAASRDDIARVLRAHLEVTVDLVGLFHARLDPAGGPAPAEHLAARLEANIAAVTGGEADRVLRAMFDLVQATVRTNHFVARAGASPRALALKFDPRRIDAAPHPRPRYETIVTSPRVDGVHVRFGEVARGGLRWSDRRADFRSEVFALARAQSAKNAIIVPAGAKGGFVVKRSTEALADREALLTEGRACYAEFIDALLDVVDDIDPVSGQLIPGDGVRSEDGDDAYLVVAADKGTATFSDLANSVSTRRGFWLGDAFASGGSVGYDHKKLGITAAGAWRSARRHFAELGVDPERDPITAVGIGDMSGDVFGNGMLLSRSLRLVAAFDHRHIFLDPTPEPEAAWRERRRLFELRGSSWADYAPDLLSAGGGVYSRADKWIPISDETRRALGLDENVDRLTPDECIRGILRADVDLLFNGGVGTYVKSQSESALDVADRANDAVRVDGAQLRARVVVEGANLGLTQRGRIEFARAGGAVDTDAHDNSAGVACSDYEVNIKIVVDAAVAAGALDVRERPGMIASMSDAVVDAVLSQNVRQNEMLGLSRRRARERRDEHERVIADLEVRHGFDRAELDLPDDRGFAKLRERDEGLSSPELAVLSAAVRRAVKADLSDAFLDEASLEPLLLGYFPAELVERFGTYVTAHPLRRAILATVVTNLLIDQGGLTLVHRLQRSTNASVDDCARAVLITVAAFGLEAVWARVRASHMPIAASDLLRIEIGRLVERAARWLLVHRRGRVDLAAESRSLRTFVAVNSPRVDTWLRPADRANRSARAAAAREAGAPADLIDEVFALLDRFCLLDIAEVTSLTSAPPSAVGETYFTVKDEYRINALLQSVSELDRADPWSDRARQGLRDDLYGACRRMTARALAGGGGANARGTVAGDLGGWTRDADAVDALVDPGLAPLSVVVRGLVTVAAGGQGDA